MPPAQQKTVTPCTNHAEARPPERRARRQLRVRPSPANRSTGCATTTGRCSSSAGSRNAPPRCTSGPRSVATATSTSAKRRPSSASMDAMAPHDYLFTTYREHGYAIARGIEPGRIMAELFGRTTGVSQGLGRLDAPVRRRCSGCLAATRIVGGQIPPATGAALAIAYRGPGGPDTEAVVCQLGDATTNIGAWHESLNLAAIWRLPIVYVVVNNHLGMGTPVEKAVRRARPVTSVGRRSGCPACESTATTWWPAAKR